LRIVCKSDKTQSFAKNFDLLLKGEGSQLIDKLTHEILCKVFHHRRGVFIPGRLACVPQAKPLIAFLLDQVLALF